MSRAPVIASLLVTASLLASLGACSSDPAAPPAAAPGEVVLALGGPDDPEPLTAPGADSGALLADQSYHYRVTVPAGHDGLRFAVRASAPVDVVVRRNGTSAGALRSSADSRLHTHFFAPDEVSADNAWYVEIHADQAATYDLAVETVYARALAWDPGQSVAGSAPAARPAGGFGDYLYKTTSQLGRWGPWRSVLRVSTGEAGLFLGTTAPTEHGGSYQATETGSDMILLAPGQFQANQTWYLRVRATTTDANWSLVSGDVFVHELGALAANGSSGGTLTADVGGLAWLRSEATADTLAWRLASPGTRIWVNDTAAPVPDSGGTYDLVADDQILVVPPYLVAGGYLAAVVADDPARTTIVVDSRRHTVRTPSADPTFAGTSDFAFTLSGEDDGGFGFVTYRVDVPIQQIAWRVAATATSGHVDLYIRKGAVPSDWDNHAMSEAAGTSQGLAVSPPTLTDGAWYVTVRGTPPFEFTLTSGNPTVTPIAFINDATPVDNGAAFEDDVGWRYFVVDDIDIQPTFLGWILELLNQAPGTGLAIRKNQVPSRFHWRSRTNGYIYEGQTEHTDAASDTGFLERPDHEADIWYVGVESADAPLGPFRLRTRAVSATDLALNGGVADVSQQTSGRWRWFKVTVPADALGWDVRLSNVTSGQPRLVVRAEKPPGAFGDFPYQMWRGASWASGAWWSPGNDLSRRPSRLVGDVSVDESGRIFTAGMGGPLDAGVYYVGVSDLYAGPPGTSATPMTYRITSRGIGVGATWSLPVQTLTFAGGQASASGLAPRDLRVYRVDVPAGAASFAVELVPSAGDATLAVRKGHLPNTEAGIYDDSESSNHTGLLRDKAGTELYYRWPSYNETTLTGGTYYLVVTSQGVVSGDNGSIGSGTTSYTLRSVGAAPVLGGPTLEVTEAAPLTWQDVTLRYGEQKLHRFFVPSGTSSVEVRLTTDLGRPWYSVGAGLGVPAPAQQSYVAAEGGGAVLVQGDGIQTLQGPDGVYTVIVTALRTDQGATPAARYDLDIIARGESVLDFDGGGAVVVAQESQTWRYFKVVVPDDALGWDLRLVNVQSGAPRMVVRRDTLPGDWSIQPSCCPALSQRTSWESGDSWPIDYDLTQRPYDGSGDASGGVDVYGRAVQMGLGSPLSPGTYYVGVSDSWQAANDEPMSYEVVSRGIGVGASADSGEPWSIQVGELPFDGGTDTVTLPARDTAYYRVDVPVGVASWDVELLAEALGGAGEAALIVQEGHLPNPSAYAHQHPESDYQRGGARRQQPGDDFFYRYPDYNQAALEGGTYYLAVVSEGVIGEYDYTSYIGDGSSTVTVRSRGEVDVQVAPAPLSEVAPIRWSDQTLRRGEQAVFRFEVPEGLSGMEISLENTSGEPYFDVGQGAIPSPTQSYYAAFGGWGNVGGGDGIFTASDPAGVYYVVVSANHFQGVASDASFDLVVEAVGDQILAMNGGSIAVDDQPADTWRYFRVTVPSTALGWELALEDVTAGSPQMVIQRDEQPTALYTNPSCCPPIHGRGEWQSGWSWAVGADLTRRHYGEYDPDTGGEPQSGRRVQMGLGAPLEPGVYIVGVSNAPQYSEAMSYRIVSQGIGVGDDPSGDPWTRQVLDLPLGGTVDTPVLPAREVAYYRIVVPQGSESFGVELETLSGESMMAVRRGTLPNSEARPEITADTTYELQGTRRQKAGGEFFYAHPLPGERSVEPDGPGVWYVAVASEGQDPYSTSYIGSGSSRARLTTVSPVPIVGDTTRVVDQGEVRFDDEALRYGERKLYRFRVAPDVPAFEVRLANRTGSPRLSANVERYFDPAAPSDDANAYYYRPADNGEYPEGSADVATTFVAKPGDVTVAVYAYGPTPEDMGYDLVVTPLRPSDLPWDGGLAQVTMKDEETRFFRVEVPADCDGVAQAGWIVGQETSSGKLHVEVRKDTLPGDPTGGPTLTTEAKETIIVPPFLEPGTWYVAVRADGVTQGTITTTEVTERRVWTMPPRGQSAGTPGLVHPVFADTGVDAAGQPIQNQGSSDQGVDLGQGRFHFYRVRVPADNRGYLRTRLEAISGDPDLYIRRGAAPTLSHSLSYYTGGLIADYRDTSDGTSYGHWVPTNARNGTELAPGDYWVAVYAQGSNVRYRLIMDVGNIVDLAQSGGAATGQALAAGDMRLYRVAVPKENVPTQWYLDLTQQSGDVVVMLREEIPAGFYDQVVDPSYADGYMADWNDDREAYAYGFTELPHLEETGVQLLGLPEIRPDTDYILSVFARSDATYDLRSTVAPGRLALDGVLTWPDGVLNVTLPAGAYRTYRVDVPADAGRWRHQLAVPVAGVWAYLSQGLIPPRSTYAHWTNNGYPDSYYNDLDRVLDDPGPYVGNFPFVPGQSYYLVLENKTGAPQAVTYTLDGRDWDDDADGDALPDGWESRYFGQGGTYPQYDGDGDGLDDATELALGTHPRDIDTDDDDLYDGDEVVADADPLAADTDLDQVCDGSDSAPRDPSESGPIIRLRMGEMNEGAYGHGYGTNEHTTRLVAVFEQSYGPKAYWLHVTGWGIDQADEVEVRLNGEAIGLLPTGGAASHAIPRIFWIDAADVRAGLNRVELRQKTSGQAWGVKELGLFTFGESFGADSTRAYDVRHPQGLDLVVPAIGDVLLELTAFDLERADDVTVTLGGQPFLPAIPGSGALVWSPRWQVPVLADETEPGGRVLSIRPRAGSDGDFQVRWVDCRPLLSTLGTEGHQGEDGHLRAGVGFLLPEADAQRELVVEWRVTDAEEVARGGSLEDAATLPSAGTYTWTRELSFAPATRSGPATVTWQRVVGAEPAPYPTFVVGVRYYGPCTDYDNDSVSDCESGCAADDADCDGVPDASDCAPDDPDVSTTNVGDRDCDGVPDASDCAPDDPGGTLSSVGDQDCDGVSDREDCGPDDPTITTTSAGDEDCDGVPDAEDCEPTNAAVTTSSVGDRDCDGVGDATDCAPDNAAVTTTNVGDRDCDGVGDATDCAPDDTAVTTSNVGDRDCDGVGDATDCAPDDAAVTTTNVGDRDCDGVADVNDCAPDNAAVTTTNVGDRDCDGVADVNDCAPDNAAVTTTNVGDQDCDGVPDTIDCGATNPGVTTSTAEDGDCDGVRKGLDCDDADASEGSRDGDLDCDGVPQLVDCDDSDPSAGTSVGDADCDDVPTADDCDDRDPRFGSRVGDADCDGVAAGVDCDDADPSVAMSCLGCVDQDLDEHYAIGNGCAVGDDCDDDDAEGTLSAEDADCDGSKTEDDCDDEDPEVVGACPSACVDADDDGEYAVADDCPSGRDCDDDDAASSTLDADADCDGYDNDVDVCPGLYDDQADGDEDLVGDACDVCPDEPDPAQADGDSDGVGDACVDGDGDLVPDHRDNCPHVGNPDQADADADGLGDACDATEVLKEEGGCGGGGALGGALAALALMLVLVRPSRLRLAPARRRP